MTFDSTEGTPASEALTDSAAKLLEDLQQLCGLIPEGAVEATSISTAQLEDMLTPDEDEVSRSRRWVGAATEAACRLARASDAILAWKIARIAFKLALTILTIPQAQLSPSERRGLQGAQINLLNALGDAAQFRGRRVVRALVAARMLVLWKAEPGADVYARQIAGCVEQGVKSLLEYGRFKDAGSLAEQTPKSIRDAHHNWDEVVQSIHSWTKPAWSAPKATGQVAQDLFQSIKAMAKSTDSQASNLALELLEKLGSDDMHSVDRLLEALQWLEQHLKAIGRVDPLDELRLEESLSRYRIAEASAENLVGRATRLAEIAGIHAQAGRWQDAASAYLADGLALRHAGRRDLAITAFGEAVDCSERISVNMSAGFSAGAFEQARIFYAEAIDSLCDAGKIWAALRLAEHYKGSVWRQARGLSSIRAREMIATKSPWADLRGFVSYFIEESALLVFVVDGQNELKFHRFEINRVTLISMTGKLTPNGWRTPGAFAPGNPKAIEALSVLVTPLERMLHNDREKPGSLTISPDGILHNVPWHLLDIKSRPLIDWLPVQTVLGLDHRNAILALSLRRPVTASIYLAPAQDQQDSKAWLAWGTRLRSEISRSGLDADIVFGLNATGERVLLDLNSRDLLHIRSHGHFPENAEVEAVFSESGLMLSNGNHLPTRGQDAQPELTPEVIMRRMDVAQPADFGFLALEACVSGVVRDGAAGDPVSLPWLLSLLGLRSIIASHWSVATAHAETYFGTFYRTWLHEKSTRTVAHRAATLVAIREHGSSAAAFRLIGDWR